MPNPQFLVQGKRMFPVLPKAQQKLPKNPVSNAKRIGIDFDGTLAEPRDNHGDPGNPLPGAVAFLKDCVAHELTVFIITARPAAVVSHWLKLHSPGLESIVHVTAIRPQVDLLLSAVAMRFDGKFPSCDELELTLWYQETQ
jgi:hypothetical protein